MRTFRLQPASRLLTAALCAGLCVAGAPCRIARADTPAEQFQFASGLYGQKLYSLAAEKLRDFLAANPKDPNARIAAYQLAAAIYRTADAKGNIDNAAAVTAYEKALGSYPDADPKIAAAARFELTEALFNLKNYPKTVAAATAYLATKPADGNRAAWATYYLGESQFSLKRNAEALAAQQKVLELYPTSEAAPFAQFSQGLVLADDGKNPAAAAAFKALLAHYPAAEVASEARLRLADALLASGQWTEAGEAYRAVTTDPAAKDWGTDARQGAADAAFGGKNWDAAATAYAALIPLLKSTDPARAAAQLRLGDSYFNAKHWDQAVNAYTPLVNGAGGDAANLAHALYFRGGAQRAQNHFADAAADYRKVVDNYPKDGLASKAALRLGDSLADNKDIAGAAAAYKLVLTGYPGSSAAGEAQDALVGLASDVSAAPKAAGAIGTGNTGDRQALEKVLSELPAGAATGNARLRLAQGAYARGDWKEAAALSQGALEGATDAAIKENALYLLGSSQLQSGDNPGATGAFKRQLTLAPTGKLALPGHLGLAYSYSRAKAWPLAATAARETLTAAGTVAPATTAATTTDYKGRAQLVLGEALLGNKEPAQAAIAYQAAGQSSEKELRVQAALGAAAALQAAGQSAAAAAQWGRAGELAGDKATAAAAYLQQGLLLAKTKAAEPALAAFDKSAAAAPGMDDAGQALYEAAWTAHDAKLTERESGYWKQIAGDYPKSKYAPEALFQQAELAAAAKQPDAALGFYQALTTRYPDDKLAPLAWYKAGSTEYAAAHWPNAGADFDKAGAVRGNEVQVESGFWAAQSYLKAGSNADAARRYAAFLHDAPAGNAAVIAPKTGGTDLHALLPTAYLGLGQAQEAQQQGTQAVASYTAGLPLAEGKVSAELNYRLGKLLLAQNQPKAALPYLLKVAIAFPGSEWAGEAQFAAALATETGGDKAAAIELYRSVAARTSAPGADPKATALTQDLVARANDKLKALGATGGTATPN